MLRLFAKNLASLLLDKTFSYDLINGHIFKVGFIRTYLSKCQVSNTFVFIERKIPCPWVFYRVPQPGPPLEIFTIITMIAIVIIVISLLSLFCRCQNPPPLLAQVLVASSPRLHPFIMVMVMMMMMIVMMIMLILVMILVMTMRMIGSLQLRSQ